MTEQKAMRRQAVSEHKRRLILDAARRIFESEGLEGASLRQIAGEAGYTPAALYFHFDSKEAIYAELLEESLAALGETVGLAADQASEDEGRLRRAALAFFAYYAEHPRELDLGFYLFRGGMKPAGLGAERDRRLNAALAAALDPVTQAARGLGASEATAKQLTVNVFAHAAGLLLLLHTGRIRVFDASADAAMQAYVESEIEALKRKAARETG